MSGAALGWAWKLPVPMSSAKFVLIAFADQTTSDLAFMSLASICEMTGQDRKTVVANIARLVEWGLIEDTGERRGRTGQIPVYRLKMGEGLFDNAHYDPKRPENGTVPKTEPVPKTDGNSTVFPMKQSQKRYSDPRALDPRADPIHTPRACDPAAAPAVARSPDAATPTPTPGALATRAMIEAGMPATRVNPSHPELLAALKTVTAQELADVTRELISHGTGPPAMVYVIRTAVGRRRTADHQQGTHDEPATHQPGNPGRAAAGRARSAVGRQIEAIRRRRAREAGGAAPAGPAGAAAGGPDG